MYLTNENYHRGEKYKNFVSSSMIKQASVSGRNTNIKYEEKPTFNLGTAFHSAILEPERFRKDILTLPEINRRTKAGKEAYQNFLLESKGRTVIDAVQAEKLECMVESVCSHPVSKKMINLKDNRFEHSFFWEDKKIKTKLKARADIINFKKKIIIDLKTCRNSHPDKFKWQAKDFKYDTQAYHYLRGANQLFGGDFIFLFICTESVLPYNTTVFIATKSFIEQGKKSWEKGMKILKEKDVKSHYTNDIIELK